MTGLEKLYEDVGLPIAGAGRAVLGGDNTERFALDKRETGTAFSGEGIDKLFGGCQHYHIIKNEKPEHRWMLWLKVNGYNAKEIAAMTGYHYVSVCMVLKQDWFRRAVVQVINELGFDKAKRFLEGQEAASYQTMIDIRDGVIAGPEAAVRLAASDRILDRIRGKPIAKTEIKSETTVDVAVHDAATLLREREDNERKLRANGIVVGGSN